MEKSHTDYWSLKKLKPWITEFLKRIKEHEEIGLLDFEEDINLEDRLLEHEEIVKHDNCVAKTIRGNLDR